MAANGLHVIDAHHHVGTAHAVKRSGDAQPIVEDSEEYNRLELATRLAMMESQGVDQAIIIAGHGYLRPNGHADTVRINDRVAAYSAAHPDRFPATIGVAEPLFGAVSFDELRRVKYELGFAGVSFHARFQGVASNSGYVIELVKEMEKLELVPYVHAIAASLDCAWWKIQDLAEAIPDTPVLALDGFSSSEMAWEAVRVATKNPNIYFDTSVCGGLHFVMPVIQEVGPERVIFGTDTYSYLQVPPRRGERNVIDALRESDLIDDDAKQLILAGNIRRLLKIG